MADAEHSKCFARKGVGVQVPPPAQNSPRSAVSPAALTDGSKVVEIVVIQIASIEIVVLVEVVILLET
jgi:hypothetical protein